MVVVEGGGVAYCAGAGVSAGGWVDVLVVVAAVVGARGGSSAAAGGGVGVVVAAAAAGARAGAGAGAAPASSSSDMAVEVVAGVLMIGRRKACVGVCMCMYVCEG